MIKLKSEDLVELLRQQGAVSEHLAKRGPVKLVEGGGRAVAIILDPVAYQLLLAVADDPGLHDQLSDATVERETISYDQLLDFISD